MFNSFLKEQKLIDLHIRIDKATFEKINTLASSRKESFASTVRRFLSAGLDTEIAEQSIETLTSVVRKAIRAELVPVRKLGARASVAAGTTEHMLTELFEKTIQGDTSEKLRQAKSIHEEARKKAIKSLKEGEPDA